MHGRIPGFGRKVWDLQLLAVRLDEDRVASQHEPPATRGLEAVEVTHGVWAMNLLGARRSDRDFAVVSLCRTGGHFGHEVQRFASLTDDDSNPELVTVLEDVLGDIAALGADGRRVLVHCHAGASRTGRVLRAWVMCEEGDSAREATQWVAAAWPHLSLWSNSFTRALEERAQRDGRPTR